VSRLDTLRRLFAHLRWADDRALASLRDQPGELVSRALSIYAHVLGAEHVWLSRLREEPTTVPVWPEFTIDECARSDQESHARYQAYLSSLADADLDREVGYVNSAGQAFRSKVEDILLHVSLHGSYHRGQVALLIRDGGGVPSPTDYIAFVRGVPAATRTGR